MALLGAGPVLAQPAPPCQASVDAAEADALATVTVRSECRRGSEEPVSVSYGDDVFLGHFDETGTARVSFVLFKPADNQVKVRLSEEPPVSRSLDVPEFGAIKRVTLIWQAPVRLRLHVVEPGSRPGQAGSVNEDQPNWDGDRARGRMDLAGGAPGPGRSGASTTAEQSFVLKGDAGRGVFSYYVENASLGTVPALPFCGDGALAAVQFRLAVLEHGTVQDDVQYETARVPCGQPVAHPLRRIR